MQYMKRFYGGAIVLLIFLSMVACAMEDMDGKIVDDGEFVAKLQDIRSGVLLIDRSGSMTTVRSATGNTRCVDALTMAREKVQRFFRDLGGLRIAIWTFQDSGVTPLHAGYITSEAAALSYVDSLSPTGCSGYTPLAEAMCRAVDGKPASVVTLSPLPGYLAILTDGGENNSDVCNGPLGDIFTAGTWPNQVYFKIFGKVVNVDTSYWIPDTVLNFTGQSRESDLPESDLPESDLIDIELGTAARPVVNNSTCANENQCESHLFYHIQSNIGGTYGVVRDSDDDYPCSYGQCPPPKPPGPSGEPPEW